MAKITNRDKGILDNAIPSNQNVGLGTIIQSIQDGTGLELPTSDPSVAGALWSDSGTVKVSSG